jgi:NTE family protein
MSESTPSIRRALILSGGGGRGAYQVGVWRRLQEIGWQPDIVCGTSIGAINGALIGSGWDAQRMEQLWGSLHEKNIFKLSMWRQFKYRVNKLLGRQPNWPAFMDNEPARQMLREVIDLQRLRNDQPRVVVAATNVLRSRLEYFSGEELTAEHILASCSIPAIFPWCEINGELYWDGGVMANTPIGPAIRAGATEILVVLMAPLAGEQVDPPQSTRQALAWAFDMITIGSAQNLAQNLAYHFGGDLGDYEQSLAEHHLLEIGGIRIGIVEPSVASGLESVLDLNPQNVKARIESGYKDAGEQLTKMFGQS